MKVLFDALASPEESGGMRLHAQEVLLSWLEQFPEDELVIIGPPWVRRAIPSSKRVRHVTWPNERFVTRILGELVFVPAVAWFAYRDYVLCSLSPVVSPLAPRRRAYAVSHDWRHVSHPEQFSSPQRIYRRIWKSSMTRAQSVMTVSNKTALEVQAMCPNAAVVVVANGRDHARRWPVPPTPSSTDSRHMVTFGHMDHKRPELAIEALGGLEGDVSATKLVVLGAEGSYRDELRALATRCGVEERCEFPGFVSEQRYQFLVSTADALLLLSNDEGFGLPVAEAEYFGVPAIVTSDSGLLAMHPGVIESEPTASGLATAISSGLRMGRKRDPFPWTWSDTVHKMREVMGGETRQP